MRSGCCSERMTTPTMQNSTGKLAGQQREGGYAEQCGDKVEKTGGKIERKLSDATLICHTQLE